MELIKTEFVYELTEENSRQFSYTAVLYTDGVNKYIACVPRRIYYAERESINLLSLNGRLVNKAHVYPPFDASRFTRFESPALAEIFTKEPNLTMYMDKANEIQTQMWETLHHEAEICEVLKKFPHRNVAKYFGCRVDEGRVTGLCFQRYSETLRQRVQDCPRKIDIVFCLDEVRKGVQHLHALGFCHNDISPDNVMFDAHNIPLIVDFDSCQPKGIPLGDKSGTLGFQRTNAMTSEIENDIFSLEKLGEYLSDAIVAMNGV